MSDTKTHILTYFFTQNLVLLTRVLRNRVFTTVQYMVGISAGYIRVTLLKLQNRTALVAHVENLMCYPDIIPDMYDVDYYCTFSCMVQLLHQHFIFWQLRFFRIDCDE